MELNGFQLLDRYNDIVRTYREASWGEFDETDSLSNTRMVLFGCSGYYGDVSDLVYEAQNAGIPVMIQDMDVK
jgi:hypothetical protein